MKKKFISSFLILLTVLSVSCRHRLPEKKIKINGQTFTVELPVTVKDKTRGLGYRNHLEEYRGMLFVYDEKKVYSFCMKGMRFPLDFVWIDGNRVVDITENVPVGSRHRIVTYSPAKPVDKILELNAGAVKKAGISIGDTITFEGT